MLQVTPFEIMLQLEGYEDSHMRNLMAVIAGLVLLAATASAADLKKGLDAYVEECKDCHGANGEPNAALAKKLKITMKDLRDPAVTAKTNAEWKKAITAGSGKMKPVKTLSNSAVDDVIAYCRTLKK